MSSASLRASRAPAGSYVLAIAIVFATGSGSGLLTRPSPWSAALARPGWHPEPWVFGPVWAIVGVLATLALARAFAAVRTANERAYLIGLASLNAFLNVSWSGLFFVTKRPDLALLDLAALWLVTAALVAFVLPRARLAAVLLLPYLVWLSVAALLNVEIVRLNAPF